MIELRNVIKEYRTGKVSFKALKGVSLNIDRGEYLAIVGPSGSGKSTMMNLIGCLDVPSDGDYFLDGKPVRKMTSNQLADLRNKRIGFVFQAFNLLPYASAFENVEVPLLFGKVPAKQRRKRIMEVLSQVGLADKADNKPTEMSGGEMQRVAIARALANEPEIILADEPTGNLDTVSGGAIIKLFDDLWKQGKTVIMITHDMNIARRAPRVVKIKDGLIEQNGHVPESAVAR